MSSRFHQNYRAPRRSPRCWRWSSQALGAIRRRRSGNADPAAGKPAAATDRPERGTAIPQPAARRAAEAASGRRARRARRRSPPPAARHASSPASPRRRRCSRPSRPIRSAAGLRPAADRRSRADRPGAAGSAAGARRPAPRRCLRSQPESECPGRAARARRRSAADAGRGAGRRAGRARRRASRSIWPTPAARGSRRRRPHRRRAPRRGPAALTTLPPSATPKDEFDLGIGYMQRKDYALAEETMSNFAQKYPERSADRGFAILARRKLLPAPAISRRRRSLPRRDHQIRQVGEGAGRPAAARTVAGGAEGKGSRLRRAWRGDAEISARLGRRQSGRRP